MAITAAKLKVEIDAETAKAEAELNRFSASMDKFGDGATKVGRKLTTYVTAPLLGVGAAAVKMGADFDTNMNVLRVTSDATAEDLDALREQAEALGADLSLPGTSAADAAEAMLELSKAGLKVQDVMSASRGVLQLSAAGNLSNAESAEIAANALNAFGLEGEEMTRIADLLAASANASSAEVTDMAYALRMSSAVAKSANVPIEDLTTALAEMANAGIKNSDAGTSMKQMLLSLMAPSNKAAGLMRDLGISIYDASGNMLPMEGLIREFSSALGGLTQEQRNAALATIFGSDAVRAANIVLMGGVDAFQQMKTAVTEQGAAAELAGARMEGLGGSMEALKNAAETALLAGIEPLKDDIADLAFSVAGWVNSFSQLDEGTRDFAAKMVLVTAAVGPATWAIGGIAKTVGTVSTVFGGAATAATTFASAWKAGLTLTTSLEVALGTTAVTIGSVTLAVGALVAVWMQWNEQIVKTNEEGQKAVEGVWTKFFEDQAAAGKNAAQVTEEYLAAQKSAEDALNDVNPLLRLFIFNQNELTQSYDGASNAVYQAATSYDEYRESLEKIAGANDLVITSTGDLVRVVTDDFGNVSEEIVQANYLIAESSFDAAKGIKETSSEAGDVGTNATNAARGLTEMAQASDALGQELQEAAQKGMAAKDILKTISESLKSAGYGDAAQGQVMKNMQASIGDALTQQEQLAQDVQLLADAFAQGTMSQEQFTQAMTQAKDGTLQLTEAQRQEYDASIQQAQGLKEAAAAAQDAAVKQLSLAQSLKDATDAQIAQAAIGELQNAYEQGTISFDDYVTAVSGVQETFGLADEKSRSLAAGLMGLTKALQDGVLPAQSYDDALKGMIQDAQDGNVDIQTLTTTFSQVPGAVDPAAQAVAAGAETIGSSTQAAAAEVDQAAASMEQAFAGRDWYSLGESVGTGLAQGITNSMSQVTAAASQAAQAATSAASNQLQAHSPSQEFVDLGGYTMEGMAIGIRKKSRQPILETVSAVKQMTDRTAQTVSSPIPAGAANISAPAQAGRSQPITLVVNIAGEELKRVILNAVSQELDT